MTDLVRQKYSACRTPTGVFVLQIILIVPLCRFLQSEGKHPTTGQLNYGDSGCPGGGGCNTGCRRIIRKPTRNEWGCVAGMKYTRLSNSTEPIYGHTSTKKPRSYHSSQQR